MRTLRRHLIGDDPARAALTVLAVGVVTAFVLVPLGLLGASTSGPVGSSAFTIAFLVAPALAGAICGWYGLGALAAVASGLAPGATFYLVVVVGAAVGVGSFGGGDSPLLPFSLVLTLPGLVAATVSFVLGVAGALRGE